MRSIVSNASELAVTDMKLTKIVSSFLVWYRSWYSYLFGYNWNKLLGWHLLVTFYDQGLNSFLLESHQVLNLGLFLSFCSVFFIISFSFSFWKHFSELCYGRLSFTRVNTPVIGFAELFFYCFLCSLKESFKGRFH